MQFEIPIAMKELNVSESFRVASLDILRGFDLFLLVFLQPVLVGILQQFDVPCLNGVLRQLDHEVWEGFRFWDLIMPLFLFMAGASMPFSFAKYKKTHARKSIYWKVLRRFVILFVLGMVVQGNLLGFDPHAVYIYTNTLQAIGTGYLVASLILLHCSVRQQIAATLLLLLIYWLPMTFCGDWTQEGNFANKIDAAVLGRFRGDPSYTWIWSSLTFGVTVMLGAFAGQIIKQGKENGRRVVQMLLIVGMALVVAALLWSLQMPIIKRIWTGSMTLLSGGFCFLLMGGFYYIIDYKGHTKGLVWLKIYGMNSITAYTLGEVVNFRSIAQSVSYGLEPYLHNYYECWLTFVNFLILFFILRLMFKQKVFLKI